jgi:hypothetical protein
MAKAKSISASSLSKLTQAAVKRATQDVPGKFLGKGPTMGYVLQGELAPDKQLELAAAITSGLAEGAKSAGVGGLRPSPVVVVRPGRITVGFIAPELGIKIR